MSQNNKQNKVPNKPNQERPPLTHFLCLPLVNAVSLPQLESSLSSFKASIPPASPTNPDQGEQRQSPLIPDDAIRPVGTLHITLGVMSLPNPERFDEALRFFHSLDLAALLHEPEKAAAQKRLYAAGRKRKSSPTELTHDDEKEIAQDTSVSAGEALETGATNEREPATPKPFTISLESMHALPRARSATVLHAAPVDPTSRLYSFCEALRDKFLEAGFLQGEYKNDPKKTQKKQEVESSNKRENQSAQDQPASTATNQLTGEEPALLEEMPPELAEETAQQSRARVATTPSQPPTTERKGELKPRPLLLHATIVNTIYIRGRKRNTGGHGKKNRRNDRYTFDARDVLAHYKDYYVDSERTIPRSSGRVITRPESDTADNSSENLDTRDYSKWKEENAPSLTSGEIAKAGTDPDTLERKGDADAAVPLPNTDGKGTGYPFIWARNFPIEAVCICEMGAKKLDPCADESGMNARLGEKYTVVAEKSLDFGAMRGQGTARISTDGSNDGSIEQGGVRISA
ncbi:hypothetical protein BDW62DRAFT_29211 [Aspergillus aurantiobrunneus]